MKTALLLLLSLASLSLVGCAGCTKPQGWTTRYLPFTDAKYKKGGTIVVAGSAMVQNRYPTEQEKLQTALLYSEFAKHGFTEAANPRKADYIVFYMDRHETKTSGYSGLVSSSSATQSTVSMSPNYYVAHFLRIQLAELRNNEIGRDMWTGDASTVSRAIVTDDFNGQLISAIMEHFPNVSRF